MTGDHYVAATNQCPSNVGLHKLRRPLRGSISKYSKPPSKRMIIVQSCLPDLRARRAVQYENFACAPPPVRTGSTEKQTRHYSKSCMIIIIILRSRMRVQPRSAMCHTASGKSRWRKQTTRHELCSCIPGNLCLPHRIYYTHIHIALCSTRFMEHAGRSDEYSFRSTHRRASKHASK
jgi:hypothetical protein